jgi:hypothetical protein
MLTLVTLASLLIGGGVQDSLPPLHTLKSQDIAWAKADPQNARLTVALKDGTALLYTLEDCDLEDQNPATDKRIVEAIKKVGTRIFTQTEQPATLPGGEDAWDKYMQTFCLRHANEIKKRRPVEITVLFVIHVRGQLTDIHVIGNPGRSDLSALAVEAIREGPAWTPARQNGRAVVSFKAEVVKLARAS